MATAAVVLGSSVLGAPGSGADTASPPAGKASGLTRDARCGSVYTMADVEGLSCTHGPDPAPPGVDVTRRRSTAELVAATSQGSTSATSSTVPCYGDGTTGPRVQAVYAYAAGTPDRSSAMVDVIAGWAGAVDTAFDDSAAKTGGVRHVRWVTDASCRLSVMVVQLSSAGDDNFSSTISELRTLGLVATDRKYLVWVDANVYCGISQFRSDDSAGPSNANEGGPSFARVDNGCWGFENSVEAHELMHMLGGVQHSAPHSTGAGHCTDDQDRMCYQDSQTTVITYVCPWEHERLFDCGNDDYFHTNPSSGSYLATHWNAAMSTFLERGAPGSEPAPAPSPGTTTTSWSGSLTRKAPTATYGLVTGSGTLSASLSFSKAKSLTLSLKRADGTLVAQNTGASPVSLGAPVSSGGYSLVVSSGGAGATFTVAVTYPSP